MSEKEIPLASGWTDEILFDFVSAQAAQKGLSNNNPDDVRWVAGYGSAMYFFASLIPKNVFDACVLDAYDRYEKNDS